MFALDRLDPERFYVVMVDGAGEWVAVEIEDDYAQLAIGAAHESHAVTIVALQGGDPR